jgi:Lrp/AsnC family leucine-responsive transcriptional regulator
MTLRRDIALDDVDWHILAVLQDEGRIPYAELGRRVALSSPAVIERVRKLEDAGVIRGYHAEVDPALAGSPVMAFIRIKTTPESYPRVVALAGKLPEVLECHRATGHDCFVLKVVVASIAHLETVLDRLMPHGEPTTSVVLSSAVTRKAIPPASRRQRS